MKLATINPDAPKQLSLWQAISEAHRYRDLAIKVDYSKGRVHFHNKLKVDQGRERYARARFIIAGWPRLSKALLWIRWI
jgi:hypothetical protein